MTTSAISQLITEGFLTQNTIRKEREGTVVPDFFLFEQIEV